ncbi:alpha/beta hydrolase [bacterium]|jgi:pimeloyl-ACP methyl ester carboxylesterase|nr:alpha/beta hydrolase [Candidatus Komeilibacteria bacterium]MBT7553536.1 alpha/beta hydrolase [bacterium]
MTSKKPILYLTGMWFLKEIWLKWAIETTKAGHQTYSMDFCNNGSPPIQQYINNAIKACLRIKEETGSLPIIFGWSMGGLVAQVVASKLEIPKLVLVCSAAPRGIANTSWPMTKRIRPYLSAILFNGSFRPSKQHALEIVCNNCPEELSSHELQLVSGKIARQILLGNISVDASDINCPCLVIAGSRDRILPLHIQQQLKQKYDAKIIIGPYGHTPMLEDSNGKLIKRILNWLD